MTSRFRSALRYAFASRLDEYREILEAALHADYRICSVQQSIYELDNGASRILVLRHDVDEISPGTEQMARLEADLGVEATYYFRLSTLGNLDVALAKEFGHEVSFHYETIADFAREQGVFDLQELEKTDYLVSCAERLARDLRQFRAQVGVPCRTIASHGAPLNRMLGITNRELLERVPGLADSLQIELEAYDRSYLGQFDCYISDTQWEINDGFRYGYHPLQAISDRVPRILMLSHPNHWGFARLTRLRRVVKCLLLGGGKDDAPFAEADRLRQPMSAP